MRTRDFARRTSALLLAVAATTALSPSPARAAMIADDPFAGLHAIESAELGDLRGGMLVGGIEVNFAVVIRTTVSGAGGPLGLETTLTVGNAGQLAQAITTAVGAGGVVAPGTNGVGMTLQGGGTSITHKVVQDQIQSLIANSASNRTVTQTTDVNVTVPDFNVMSQTRFSHTHAARVGYDSAMVGLGRF
jgi:hypothetical protein